jgi:trimethylamine--corrinoid protein Co-methyltransferase
MILTYPSNPLAPRFSVLSSDQCQELFLAAKECLQRVGVQVHNAAARDLLASHGAAVENNIVHIPPELVIQAIASTPPEFTVWGRDSQNEMSVALDRVHFGPGPTCTYFIDPQTGERRKAKRGDAGMVARVCDVLPHIDYIMGLSWFDDVFPELTSVYEFAEELANTTKPIVAWANSPEAFRDIYQMAVAVAGGEDALREKPNFAYFTTYGSPLKLADAPLDNLMQAATCGIPAICLGGPTVGLESPFTGASALTLHLASALAALTIVQLHCPGAPMAIGGLPTMMDLRTARPAYGSPEASLYSAAAMDIARFLNLPFMGTAGASESKLVDAQAGIEAALGVMISTLSGAPMVHDVGFLDCADIGSLSYLVLVDEIIGMAARVMRGVRINADTIMLDLIEEVGPGGFFLNQSESVALSRKEAWIPSLLDRNPFSIWSSKGSLTTEKLASEKVNKILATHQPKPLPGGVSETLERILMNAENRERNKQRG